MRPLEVLYSDNHILAVNKPACVLSVPDAGGDPSIFDAARRWVEHTFEKPGRAWLATVHRLDRPVSGVLLLARTSKGASRMMRAFRARSVRKVYWGVVRVPTNTTRGSCSARGGDSIIEAPLLPGRQGTIRQWLRKDSGGNTVRLVRRGSQGAQEALTHWRVLGLLPPSDGGGGAALLELRPHTGRSHQLRLAASEGLGAPLLGDLRYGGARMRPLPDRSIALHAREIELPCVRAPA
jgi:23S rRNA pseudouridine1911/1915/1917 synthase